jgi:hypothetical protein
MLKWEQKKVKRLLGKDDVKDAQGHTVLDPVSGKAKTKGRYADVTLVYPQLDLAQITESFDILKGLDAIIEAEKMGYKEVRTLAEYLNFGLREAPAVQIRRGADLSRSPRQAASIKFFANGVRSTLMPREAAIQYLLDQGVADAADALDAALAALEEPDDEGAEGGEATV